MMRTLRDMNMSKFVAEDVPLFLSLIDDLFPGMKAERNAFDDVTAALIKVRAWSSISPVSGAGLHILAACLCAMLRSWHTKTCLRALGQRRLEIIQCCRRIINVAA